MQALREVEYVGITQDTGEADLKQRSEIRDGTVTFEPEAHLVKHLQHIILCRGGLHRLIPLFVQILLTLHDAYFQTMARLWSP